MISSIKFYLYFNTICFLIIDAVCKLGLTAFWCYADAMHSGLLRNLPPPSVCDESAGWDQHHCLWVWPYGTNIRRDTEVGFLTTKVYWTILWISFVQRPKSYVNKYRRFNAIVSQLRFWPFWVMFLKLWLKVVHIDQRQNMNWHLADNFEATNVTLLPKKLASNVQSSCIDNSKWPKSKLWHYCIKATKCKQICRIFIIRVLFFPNEVQKTAFLL